MSKANKRQVGGNHYRISGSSIELWDLLGPEYVRGLAVKYVSRWRRKGGVQDLEKALHCCEKLCEMIADGAVNSCAHDHVTADGVCRRMLLSMIEHSAIVSLLCWRDEKDIRGVMQIVQLWIAVTQEIDGAQQRDLFETSENAAQQDTDQDVSEVRWRHQ